jgi:hypothetical protein
MHVGRLRLKVGGLTPRLCSGSSLSEVEGSIGLGVASLSLDSARPATSSVESDGELVEPSNQAIASIL